MTSDTRGPQTQESSPQTDSQLPTADNRRRDGKGGVMGAFTHFYHQYYAEHLMQNVSENLEEERKCNLRHDRESQGLGN